MSKKISKDTGAKTRKTLKTSTKLPKPKKMTMQNPSTAKINKPPTKRTNVKKSVDVQKIGPATAAVLAKPKDFGEGIKSVGEGIGAATGGQGIQSLTPLGQMPKKSVRKSHVNSQLRKAFSILIPAIQKEMQKDISKGAGGIIGTGLGGAIGSLAGPLGAAAGAMGGGALGDSLSGGKSKTKKTKKVNPVKNVDVKKRKKKIEKDSEGMIGAGIGGALGSLAGPLGAGAGAMAGGALGSSMKKGPKGGKYYTTPSKPKTNKYPSRGGQYVSKVTKSKGVSKSFLNNQNSVLTSATTKTVRDNDKYHEESTDVLTQKQAKMERSELDMAKSQASLRVEKAIFYLKGYEPMDDSSVKKMFHGQIPEVMKSVEARPPREWMDKAIKKSSTFSGDPIQYSLDLWYDKNFYKAVAEPIDGKFSPKKRGENSEISDGTRVDVSEITEDGKSEIEESL